MAPRSSGVAKCGPTTAWSTGGLVIPLHSRTDVKFEYFFVGLVFSLTQHVNFDKMGNSGKGHAR
jgi:hypothetical protein